MLTATRSSSLLLFSSSRKNVGHDLGIQCQNDGVYVYVCLYVWETCKYVILAETGNSGSI